MKATMDHKETELAVGTRVVVRWRPGGKSILNQPYLCRMGNDVPGFPVKPSIEAAFRILLSELPEGTFERMVATRPEAERPIPGVLDGRWVRAVVDACGLPQRRFVEKIDTLLSRGRVIASGYVVAVKEKKGKVVSIALGNSPQPVDPETAERLWIPLKQVEVALLERARAPGVLLSDLRRIAGDSIQDLSAFEKLSISSARLGSPRHLSGLDLHLSGRSNVERNDAVGHALALAGVLVSCDGEIAVRTVTDLDDGVYRISAEGAVPVEVDAGSVAVDVPVALGEYGDFEINSPFTDLIRAARLTSRVDSAQSLRNALFRVEEDGWVELMAGNPHRFGRSRFQVKGRVRAGDYLVPREAIVLAIRAAASNTLRMIFDPDRITFDTGEAQITARIPHGYSYPNLVKLIPSRVEAVMSFDHNALTAALDALRPDVVQEAGYIEMIPEPGFFRILAVGPDGEIRSEVAVPVSWHEGGEVGVENWTALMPMRRTRPAEDRPEECLAFSLHYLRDVLACVNSERVYVAGTASDAPFLASGVNPVA